MNSIKFRPGFYICVALYLLIIPVPWLTAWLFAAFIHELFHVYAIKICGFSIDSITVGAAGAQIKTDAYPGKRMILCAMAGPLSGFLLFALLRHFPRIAICGLVQSLSNLIPLYPLDGGRVFCSFLSLFFTNRISHILYKTVECIVVFFLLIIAIYCTFRFNLGIVPILMMALFLFKKKYLANNCASEYNIGNRN